MLRATAHPRRRDFVRVLLGTFPWGALLAGFLFLLVATAAAVAAGFALTADSGEPEGFFYWWRQSLLMLAGFELDATQRDSADTDFQGVQLAAALLRLLIPALLLGAFVFRFLIARDVMVFRDKVILCQRSGGEYELVFRLYSSTALQLVTLQFKVFAQIREAGTIKATNKVLELRDYSGIWPIAKPHVPYTLRLKLDSDDVSSSGELKKLHGSEVGEGSRILVQIRGNAPQLGTEFVETRSFAVADTKVAAEHTDVTVNWEQIGKGSGYWWKAKSRKRVLHLGAVDSWCAERIAASGSG
ncbi:MAG: hypothetical protein LC790_07520, partial [Actinobacteria bacterium]|nr:hypothetical protein [Actinomycetota bacterium]